MFILAGVTFILALVIFSAKKYLFQFSMSLISQNLSRIRNLYTYKIINLIYTIRLIRALFFYLILCKMHQLSNI